MEQKTNLFNNPMIDAAMKALTPEQREEYEQIGKHMFKNNYETSGPDPEKEMQEAIFYINEGLKSGLHPEDLEKKELQIMYEVYGDNWFEKYGYDRSEVPPNPTLAVELGNVANPRPSDHVGPSGRVQRKKNRRKKK